MALSIVVTDKRVKDLWTTINFNIKRQLQLAITFNLPGNFKCLKFWKHPFSSEEKVGISKEHTFFAFIGNTVRKWSSIHTYKVSIFTATVLTRNSNSNTSVTNHIIKVLSIL